MGGRGTRRTCGPGPSERRSRSPSAPGRVDPRDGGGKANQLLFAEAAGADVLSEDRRGGVVADQRFDRRFRWIRLVRKREGREVGVLQRRAGEPLHLLGDARRECERFGEIRGRADAVSMMDGADPGQALGELAGLDAPGSMAAGRTATRSAIPPLDAPSARS